MLIHACFVCLFKGRPKKAANKPKKIDKEGINNNNVVVIVYCCYCCLLLDEMFGQYVKRVTALNFGEDGVSY